MKTTNNWFVITGGPSSGKTTLISELHKLGYKTVPEAARQVIDEAVAAGRPVSELRSDEKRFQEEVLRLKLKVEAGLARKETVIFDRGMQDTTAYLRSIDAEIDHWIEEAVSKSTYKQVFLLEPLSAYETDYARMESGEEALRIYTLLEEAYSEAGMTPIKVGALSVEKRLAIILKYLS